MSRTEAYLAFVDVPNVVAVHGVQVVPACPQPRRCPPPPPRTRQLQWEPRCEVGDSQRAVDGAGAVQHAPRQEMPNSEDLFIAVLCSTLACTMTAGDAATLVSLQAHALSAARSAMRHMMHAAHCGKLVLHRRTPAGVQWQQSVGRGGSGKGMSSPLEISSPSNTSGRLGS
jgi:hypothetical protein